MISIYDNLLNLEAQKSVFTDTISLTEDLKSNLVAIMMALDEIKKATPPAEFLGQVNIQADEAQSLDVIKRVMKLCVDSGFSKINFVVRRGQ